MIGIEWKQRVESARFNRYDNIFEKLAEINGIKNLYEFLNPDESHTHDPYLLMNIDLLVEKIIKAIKGSEKIVIFSDP